MTFLAGAKGRESKDDGDGDELIELALPDDDERDGDGRLVRHGDTKLQTRMTQMLSRSVCWTFTSMPGH